MAYDLKGAEIVRMAIKGDNAACRAAYLDYVNNFLTVTGFASYYGITPLSAQIYLEYWRDLHEAHVAAIKDMESK